MLSDQARLHEIEMELDKTSPWESPPYRQYRQKLNRERDRLRARINGSDLLSSIGVHTGRYLDLSEEQKAQYRMNKQTRKIMEVINAKRKI